MHGRQNGARMAPPDSPAPTTLVVLPGLDGTEVFLRPFLQALPPQWRVRTVCYPVQGPHDYAGLLALVRQETADLDGFYVLGSSFGGPLAVMLAAAEPQRVHGIILSASFLRSPRPELHRWRHAAVWPVIAAMRAARRIPVWTGRGRQDAFRIAKAESWKRVPARSLAARARAIVTVDVRELLNSCAQPLAYVRYAEDAVVLPASLDEILELRPQTRVVTLPGAHLGMHGDGLALARAVMDLIGETVRSPA